MRSLFVFVLLTCLLMAGPVHAQRPLKVGDPAPALSAVAGGKSVTAFQPGRVYVLEFWATWCLPCLAAFDHLNSLTRDVQGQPVTFLSITSDPPAKVERLLKARPLATQVAYDRDGKTFAAYGVRVIPHTVVVGPDGKIAAITNPQAVTAKALRDILAGVPANLPVKTSIAADLEWDTRINADAPESLAHVVVQRSNADGGASRFRPGSGQIVGDGLVLDNLIQLAYNAEFWEVRSTLPRGDQTRYRVSVRAADGKDLTARALLTAVLPGLASFSARWVEEDATVPILRRIPGTSAMKPSTSKLGGLARHGEITYTGVPFKTVVSALGGMVYNTNVIDETGYTGVYDLKLTWTPDDPQSLEAALKTYGLQIARETRTVRRLIVQPAVEEKP